MTCYRYRCWLYCSHIYVIMLSRKFTRTITIVQRNCSSGKNWEWFTVLETYQTPHFSNPHHEYWTVPIIPSPFDHQSGLLCWEEREMYAVFRCARERLHLREHLRTIYRTLFLRKQKAEQVQSRILLHGPGGQLQKIFYRNHRITRRSSLQHREACTKSSAMSRFLSSRQSFQQNWCPGKCNMRLW